MLIRYFAVILFLGSFFSLNAQSIKHPDNNKAFLQDEVAKVQITIDDNDLITLLGDSLYSDHYFPATFLYTASNYSKNIEVVGFRVRGNTSRNAQKKSFKVSFNEYISGQKFKGLEKMNLVGQHNDPSLFRYWLSLKTLSDNGLICSRVSFVELYINQEYKGLYLNVEHIDDEFLQERFIDDDEGNLYKCLWGSDLTYWGSNPSNYYSTYELKTNKSEKDYSGLIDFLADLNTISNTDFPCFIEENFEVSLFLKTLATECIIGHWDGHAYNKNNFYLYQQPSNGKFVFIEYDMDNTFGIDWGGIDWSTRDLNNWNSLERPLVQRLLSYPYYRNQFNLYLEEILTYFDDTDWQGILQDKQAELLVSVQTDAYYPLDYGFQSSDFINGVNATFGAHVTQGVLQYVDARVSSGFNQLDLIANQVIPCESLQQEEEDPEEEEEPEVESPSKEIVKIYDLLGREVLFSPNTHLIYIYSDGTSERKIQLED